MQKRTFTVALCEAVTVSARASCGLLREWDLAPPRQPGAAYKVARRAVVAGQRRVDLHDSMRTSR
eukprot:6191674-Pleurochrysis_carterae.AAC.1